MIIVVIQDKYFQVSISFYVCLVRSKNFISFAQTIIGLRNLKYGFIFSRIWLISIKYVKSKRKLIFKLV